MQPLYITELGELCNRVQRSAASGPHQTAMWQTYKLMSASTYLCYTTTDIFPTPRNSLYTTQQILYMCTLKTINPSHAT
jgi:hypothetical protein